MFKTVLITVVLLSFTFQPAIAKPTITNLNDIVPNNNKNCPKSSDNIQYKDQDSSQLLSMLHSCHQKYQTSVKLTFAAMIVTGWAPGVAFAAKSADMAAIATAHGISYGASPFTLAGFRAIRINEIVEELKRRNIQVQFLQPEDYFGDLTEEEYDAQMIAP